MAVGVVGLLEQPSQQMAVQEFADCETIDDAGVYELTEEIEDGGRGGNFTFISESCIRITTSDVLLDGNGKRVNGFGVSDTTAIHIEGEGTLENVTVTNVTIDEWNRGIYVSNVTGSTIRNTNVSGNVFGVFIKDSRNVTVENVTARGDFVGMYVQNGSVDSDQNRLEDNYIGGVVRDNQSQQPG